MDIFWSSLNKEMPPKKKKATEPERQPETVPDPDAPVH